MNRAGLVSLGLHLVRTGATTCVAPVSLRRYHRIEGGGRFLPLPCPLATVSSLSVRRQSGYFLVGSRTVSSSGDRKEGGDDAHALLERARELILAKNYPEAFEILTPLAAEDIPEALHRLGCWYNIPGNPHADLKKFAQLIERAANHGHKLAKWNLAVAFETGLGVEKDSPRALQLHVELADSGYLDSQLRVGQMYTRGIHTEGNFPEGLRYLKMAAEKGSEQAISELAMVLFRNGYHTESIPYYEHFARQGYPAAQHQLGELYGNGIGVDHNHEKSRHYFQLAAEQGHPEATYTLGYIYTVGYFVEKDPERALYHLVRAAELGHWVAQHEAGEAFYRRRDFASAKKYLSMSPFPPCLTLLARMYIQGEGVAQDLHQARLLLQPLVDKGFKDATAYMAVINELDPPKDS